jgi:catechol-2,3-dioxygenase
MRPQILQTDRRRFLTWVSASWLAAHHRLVADGAAARLASQGLGEPGARIVGLKLLAAAPLAAMKEFYNGSLELRLLDEGLGRLTIGAGETQIKFVPAGSDDGDAFYHFAFNIPENKVLSAWRWQKARTPLLPIPARLRDPAYPDDVVDYRHWNAHFIFFFDPAGNVVEYIARHGLGNARTGPFTSSDILHASEIGLVVDDVLAAASELKQVAGVDHYKVGSAQFTALGDENGLLLVMQRGRVISFNAPQKKATSVFRTSASVRGSRRARYRVPGFPYEISVEG